METLELLEEMIEQLSGHRELVSHDREFVDNSATECGIYEGNGVINSYVGGYFVAQQRRNRSQSVRCADRK